MTRLTTEKLSAGYGEHLIVKDLNLALPDGRITALVGANGSGKSTILKTIGRLLRPRTGEVYLDGKVIARMSAKEIARQLAILPQNPTSPEGLTVRELVSYGRFPHQSGFHAETREDRRMVEWALAATGMTAFADRPVGQMSGGQRQRAWIAMALAQGTDILLLDEPTTYLDMAHQLEVLNLLERLNRDTGRTIVMVVHDLNQAARFAHYVVAIQHGSATYQGSPREVIHADMLREVFGVLADVVADPRAGAPLCIPYGLVEASEVRDVVV
jgi:iron complex transport system ATP-binding protein